MKLLVATDFSELAEKIFTEAEKLAKNLSAKVFLLHVIPPQSPIIDPLPDAERVILHDELLNYAAYHLSDSPELIKMRDIAVRFQEKGIDTTVIITQNNEVEAILNESEKHGADMIMLGSHGHGALFHLLIGSVSEGVIRQATCPVIIVPSRKR
ncbi:MAG: universal stress protein [Chlorobium sp.]